MKLAAAFFVMMFALSGSLSAEEYQIDANRNCLFLNKAESFQGKAVKVKLDMNTKYRVSLSEEGYFSSQQGAAADPMPGVVLFYPANEQDGFASMYRVIKSGETVRFVTPNEDDNSVFLLAFVMDYWHESANAGRYMLTVEKE